MSANSRKIVGQIAGATAGHFHCTRGVKLSSKYLFMVLRQQQDVESRHLRRIFEWAGHGESDRKDWKQNSLSSSEELARSLRASYVLTFGTISSLYNPFSTAIYTFIYQPSPSSRKYFDFWFFSPKLHLLFSVWLLIASVSMFEWATQQDTSRKGWNGFYSLFKEKCMVRRLYRTVLPRATTPALVHFKSGRHIAGGVATVIGPQSIDIQSVSLRNSDRKRYNPQGI